MMTVFAVRRLSAAALVLTVGMALSSCAADPVLSERAVASPTPTASADAKADASISAIDFAEGEQDGAVQVSVDGGEDGVGVTFREITIKPGASTGVHCHYGQLIGVVKQGSLTHYADLYPDGVHVYETGDSLVEGASYQHEGRNEGTTDVILWVTYIIPEGKPLAETVLANCG